MSVIWDSHESLLTLAADGGHKAARIMNLFGKFATSRECYAIFELPREAAAHKQFVELCGLPGIEEPVLIDSLEVFTPQYAEEKGTISRQVAIHDTGAYAFYHAQRVEDEKTVLPPNEGLTELEGLAALV